jgi:hypothetical protein
MYRLSRLTLSPPVSRWRGRSLRFVGEREKPLLGVVVASLKLDKLLSRFTRNARLTRGHELERDDGLAIKWSASRWVLS